MHWIALLCSVLLLCALLYFVFLCAAMLCVTYFLMFYFDVIHFYILPLRTWPCCALCCIVLLDFGGFCFVLLCSVLLCLALLYVPSRCFALRWHLVDNSEHHWSLHRSVLFNFVLCSSLSLRILALPFTSRWIARTLRYACLVSFSAWLCTVDIEGILLCNSWAAQSPHSFSFLSPSIASTHSTLFWSSMSSTFCVCCHCSSISILCMWNGS